VSLGLNLARTRTVVCLLRSPHWLLANADQYLGHDPLILSEKLASRHGLSLPRRDCPLSKTTPARSPLLAYDFDRVPDPSSSPFGLELRSSTAFGGWGTSTLPARCLIPDRTPPDVHCHSLPFRTFIPPDQSALTVTGSGEAYLNEQPDFPSLPDSANYH
jgi:hypothetical protein